MPDFEVPIPVGFNLVYPALIDRWIDGDSCVAHVRHRQREESHGIEIRVDLINAVELKTQFGAEAKAYAEKLCPTGTAVALYERIRLEKYGRELARIVLPDGSDFGTQMLLAKASDGVTPLAVPYNP